MTRSDRGLAVLLTSSEVERFYSALSLLVSAAVDGAACAALASFRALELLLDDDLLQHAQEPEWTPSLSWAGRDTFAASLLELRETALELDPLELYACSASVDTMGLTAMQVEGRLDGVMSTPRFLREFGTRTLLFA